jgi:hypothetical protein
MVQSHSDMAKFTNFVITPMSFFAGHSSPFKDAPRLKYLIQVLPLTHTSLGLRSAGEGTAGMALHCGVLAGYFLVLFIIRARYCKKVE